MKCLLSHFSSVQFVSLALSLLLVSVNSRQSQLVTGQAKGVSIPGISNPSLSSYIVDRSKHLMRRVSS